MSLHSSANPLDQFQLTKKYKKPTKARKTSQSISDQDFEVDKHVIENFTKNKKSANHSKSHFFSEKNHIRQFLTAVEILRLNKNLREMDKYVAEGQNTIKGLKKKNEKL